MAGLGVRRPFGLSARDTATHRWASPSSSAELSAISMSRCRRKVCSERTPSGRFVLISLLENLPCPSARWFAPICRSCLIRVSAAMPRVEEADPSPESDIPPPRFYRRPAGFGPNGGQASAKEASRPAISPVLGPPLGQRGPSPVQPATLTDAQLEEFGNTVLGSSSSVWSAEARNLPASTSGGSSSADEVLARVHGKGPGAKIAALKSLTESGELDTAIRVLQDCSKPTLEVILKRCAPEHPKQPAPGGMPCRSDAPQQHAGLANIPTSPSLPLYTRRWHYKGFVEAVGESLKAKPALQFLKLAAPHVQKPGLYMEVLKACARCRDLDAGMTVVELARKHGVKVDGTMLTTLIKGEPQAVVMNPRPCGHQLTSLGESPGTLHPGPRHPSLSVAYVLVCTARDPLRRPKGGHRPCVPTLTI